MRLEEDEKEAEEEKEADRGQCEKLEEENMQLGKALGIIWSEIHCLHDDIDFILDLIRNVNTEDLRWQLYPPGVTF